MKGKSHSEGFIDFIPEKSIDIKVGYSLFIAEKKVGKIIKIIKNRDDSVRINVKITNKNFWRIIRGGK
jgi:hypothetical protein